MIHYIVYLVIVTLFYKFCMISVKCVKLYKSFKNVVDPNNDKNMCCLLYDAAKTLYSVYTFSKKKEIPVEKFNRNYIKIPYKYKNKSYFYLLKVDRGITPLLNIKDENENDILDVIQPYLGPNLDCHGVVITPHDFGYKKIKVTTFFDTECEFGEHDQIIF